MKGSTIIGIVCLVASVAMLIHFGIPSVRPLVVNWQRFAISAMCVVVSSAYIKYTTTS